MLFAAGLGTRLVPLTNNTPKALVKVNNKTLLQYALEYLIKYNVTDVVINVHHFAQQIKDFVNAIDLDINIYISDESEELLDTGGGLLKAKDFFSDVNNFILYNTDIYTSLNLNDLYNYHIKNKNLATLAVRNRKTSRYLLFDKNGRMYGWENTLTKEIIICNDITKKQLSSYAFSGVHIVDSEIFKFLENNENKKFSITKSYIELCCNNKISGFIDNSPVWIDAGKPESLKVLEEIVRNN